MDLLPGNIHNSRVLLSALDWGMGHTTRCVSIIRQLLQQNNSVSFAGNESQIAFLRTEFPELDFFRLEGYNVRLDSEKNTYWQILMQAFKLSGAESREHRWLKDHLEDHQYDYIISDNRYGFYHKEATSIMLTHQLNLQLPTFAGLTSDVIQKKVNRFSTCWIPDDELNLSGELSNAKLSIPVHRIGILGRFDEMLLERDIECTVILSGPEPSRSQFEAKCVKYLQDHFKVSYLVGTKNQHEAVQSVSNPSTEELNKLISRSELIISRAGYTTIMEMVKLNQKAILVPTPGQYEQEYLAATVHYPCLTFQKEDEIF